MQIVKLILLENKLHKAVHHCLYFHFQSEFVCVSPTEFVCQLPAADLLSFLAELQCMLGNFITRNVGRHDEDSVLTFDGLPFAVCETTLREAQERSSE